VIPCPAARPSSDFLIAANRIFSKLEQGSKTNGQSKAWFGRKRHERRTNPLLRYIHHARNADEHGLAKVTDRTASGLALGVGPGMWRFDGTTGPGGGLQITAMGGQVPGLSKFVEIIPSKVRLIKVFDCGDPYDPPLDASALPQGRAFCGLCGSCEGSSWSPPNSGRFRRSPSPRRR
jgi:hypothetical protein